MRAALVGPGDLGAQTQQCMKISRWRSGRRRDICRRGEDHDLCGRLQAGGPGDHRRRAGPFFASDKPPASTLVGVSALALPGWLIGSRPSP